MGSNGVELTDAIVRQYGAAKYFSPQVRMRIAFEMLWSEIGAVGVAVASTMAIGRRQYGCAEADGDGFCPQGDEEQDVQMKSISFHQQGERCVTSRSDGVISVINCLSGMVTKTIFSKRYGVDLIKFTHHPDCVLFSSLNEQNDFRIRYHSLFDNKFLRYYTGHTNRVTSLVMHPSADAFVSASLDGTICIWDLRRSEPTAIIRTAHMPVSNVCAAYDQEGVVFAVYTDDFLIRMYDARNYQEGPFAKFSLYDTSIISAIEPYLARMQAPNVHAKKLHALDLKFSPDGNNLLVTTNRGVFLQLDAFEGHLLHMFHAHHVNPKSEVKLGATYSADGAYVTTGSEDGCMYVYKTSTGELVHALARGHQGPIVDLQWNPQRHLLASVGSNSTVFWTAAGL